MEQTFSHENICSFKSFELNTFFLSSILERENGSVNICVFLVNSDFLFGVIKCGRKSFLSFISFFSFYLKAH